MRKSGTVCSCVQSCLDCGMQNTRALLLADTVDFSRGMTMFYFKSVKEVDPYLQPEINGKKMNSIYWIAAHLAWAQNFLLLEGTGGSPLGDQWLQDFKLGSDGVVSASAPDFKTILNTMKDIHHKSMEHLRSLSDDDLDRMNPLNIGFGKPPTIQVIIQHHLRHEATHAGQLGWIAKAYAKPAI